MIQTATVLFLGNTTFSPKEHSSGADSCQLASQDARQCLEVAANYLRVDRKELERVVTTRKIEVCTKKDIKNERW